MLKLTKKADYGLIALRHLATARRGCASAKDIAEAYRIPLPLLSKVLQKLAKAGLLTSEQGTNGGYKLARDPHEISALEVIRTLDGPIILTHCFTEHAEPRQPAKDARATSFRENGPPARSVLRAVAHECDQSSLCPVREPLRKVHEGILKLLSGITVSDLSQDEAPIPILASGIQSTGIQIGGQSLTSMETEPR